MKQYTLLDLTTTASLNFLQTFVANLGEASNTFRYFNKRDLDIVKTHIVSLLVLENDIPVAYGHLDKDEVIIWLGICVLPNYQGRKIGVFVMNELIARAKEKKISQIHLTVDTGNINAVKLYEKLNFTRVAVADKYYTYILNI